MNQRQGTFATADGSSHFYQYWLPAVDTHAVIILVHGAGEHSGRYERFAAYCADRGYAVAALDHRGHGKSSGTRVHVQRFDDYLDGLEVFHRQVANDWPQLPLFLLGHSLGGLIGSRYLLRHQSDFAGCVLSGPAIMTEIEPGWLQTLLIRLLARVYPSAGVLQLDATGVSRDPEEVQRYLEDPLVHNGKMTARLVSELFDAMTAIRSTASGINLPILLLHGGADAMTAPEGSRFLYNSIGSQDKELKIYPGLFHEIFNEPEYLAVYADVLTWCESKLPESR